MTSPLISPAELAALDGPTVLDVRWRLGGPPGLDFYREGHIEGAVYCDLDADLAAPPSGGGRHPLPEAGAFQSAMRRLGVFSGRPVVVYDDAGATVAARAWWTLRYFGHQDVRVLDGGLPAWIEAGLPITKDVPRPAEGDFTARPGGMPALTADEAAALAGQGVLLDARAGERYRGEVEPIDPVAGHVPGAVSAPTTENLGPGGRFLAADALRDRFAGLGVREGVATGAYCGSGVTAAHEVLALEVAGLPASLYVGSWSDWSADPSRPVATGA
ncbi:thiosulfate/3-mercaptopyruvate sulfurtransferase [Nonomuraea thailandensis]|uniref:Thiosulfate/3-mercaptopyruvate sulfurtransferase n=1 Tax=Nonomuraea thailandensis TaxID=1188745 RepID=A0A9X2GAB9_9ACTN|nr:sulfurtransferase [Nonomuraea thailandensis]MCP2354060.1 thiosulfate/3-mercaptopyruvate sulfurtransferase [Nonomuraea thailandensis]